MQNREVFQRDPIASKLLNDGVASVHEAATAKEIETLRYELEHFVCEGQYESGLRRILESYLGSVDSTTQPAAWVSGFYGSGKSHLLKMFRHLWVNTQFDDNATARGLANLPQDVQDLLRELDTFGKRCGGRHAASGTLPSGGGESVRLAVMSIILASKGLPESLPQAEFCMWLKKNEIFDHVNKSVESCGKNFTDELHDLYVSPVLAKAVLDADPDFAADVKQARAALRAQYPTRSDITTSEFIRLVRDVLSVNGQIPGTVLVLDEIQLFIGNDPGRSTDVQEVAEALCKQLDSRVLLIGAGQTALAGSVPLLQRLTGRFTIPVELSDSDVETVTRRVVLAKKADKKKSIEEMVIAHAGEIDRQLAGTRIASCAEDRNIIVDDYPLLPVRRRFWEHVLRAVDIPGTASQLRTQLKIVYEAVRQTAKSGLGTVVPADFIYEQISPDLRKTGVLLREIDETIRRLDDGSDDGRLAQRLCGLVFLIRKLPIEQVANIGVQATPDMLADLMVSDLANDGTDLRKRIPRVLKLLADPPSESGRPAWLQKAMQDKGALLIEIDGEYSLQTRESSEWDREFRNRATKLNNDLTTLADKRGSLISAACSNALKGIKLIQGKCKEPRKIVPHFASTAPPSTGADIPVWVRDGWGEKENAVTADARSSGSNSPVVYIYIPKVSADDLQKAIVEYEAAKATLEIKGTPNTPEGREARDAMATRMSAAEATRNQIVNAVIDRAKVFQGGGNECMAVTLQAKVEDAAQASLDRLFPNFKTADDNRWHSVINRAKNGDEAALSAVDWSDVPEKHPVCAAVLAEVGSGKKGKEIRDAFEASPYGWPRDAVDAALITLHTTGHLRATHKNTVLARGQLDQAKVSVTDFRAETVTITAKDKIKLRKLFQSAGINCKSDEETAKAPAYLARLAELADHAGDDAPLPPKPATKHFDDLRGFGGAEQLAEILKQHDTLEKQADDWGKLADLAAKRKPAWETLCSLLKHAAGIDGLDDLASQADAVKSERRLLDASDPVPDIRKAVADALRKEVTAAHGNFEKTHKQQMAILTASDDWKKLTADQQTKLLEDEGIDQVPALSVGSESDLTRTLEQTPLSTWKAMADALPQQFSRAAVTAAKLLEPKTQSVHLTSGTLTSEAEVKKWVDNTEVLLLSRLRDGPVVIS
ncbi:MAG: BREX system P-loop protein BrxC [Planctomycetes bacterium]|nr:BREX system P-loop protein BrxC [Planctomycetota bacterium]NOG54180.1 BREX system P-loop protein BrxC [Planctomycetota bacterium]